MSAGPISGLEERRGSRAMPNATKINVKVDKISTTSAWPYDTIPISK